MFLKGNNKKGKLFLQDGDPSQNCKISTEPMEKVGCRLFKIPARSPDLNPIENGFHLIGKKLREDAVSRNLTKETFRQFSKRIIHTVLTFPTNVIDKTIESMPSRIDNAIKCQGQRTNNCFENDSFTTNFVNNSDVQLINKRVTNESPYKSTLVKRISRLKQKKIHEPPRVTTFLL